MKKLSLWNGRPYGPLPQGMWKRDGDGASVNVAAYSVADARRVCTEAGFSDPGVTEITKYWSRCWGNSMNGIKPERGFWIVYGRNGKPERKL